MVHEPTSLDAPVGEDGDATLADLIKAPDAVDPQSAAAEASALQRIVSEALADLTPREQRILRMRFGIGSTADHTFEEIGKEFGVTRERIRPDRREGIEKPPPSGTRTQACDLRRQLTSYADAAFG